MAEYIDKAITVKGLRMAHDYDGADFVSNIPAADVVEVRQIRAFIDRLVAERDKYDLHSMRWEDYDCERLLIEEMLDKLMGGADDA